MEEKFAREVGERREICVTCQGMSLFSSFKYRFALNETFQQANHIFTFIFRFCFVSRFLLQICALYEMFISLFLFDLRTQTTLMMIEISEEGSDTIRCPVCPARKSILGKEKIVAFSRLSGFLLA